MPRVKKPVPGKPSGQGGAYELKRAFVTGCAALVAQIIYAASSDNVATFATKDGVIMTGIAAFLAVVRFVHECSKDNTQNK